MRSSIRVQQVLGWRLAGSAGPTLGNARHFHIFCRSDGLPIASPTGRTSWMTSAPRGPARCGYEAPLTCGPSCENFLAVAGARAATTYGKHAATAIAEELAGRGWAIVSGCSYGIDTAAHHGTLATARPASDLNRPLMAVPARSPPRRQVAATRSSATSAPHASPAPPASSRSPCRERTATALRTCVNRGALPERILMR